jgi:hypothetical protein
MMLKNMNLTDRIILVVASSLLVIFSYVLFTDSTISTSTKTRTDHEQRLGEIYSIHNDVRRKSQGDFSWMPSTKSEIVFTSDSLFTGNNSEASIRLSDGTLIHVKPNSLIALSMKQGQLELNLKYGDLVGEVKKSTELVIRSGADVYQLQGPASTPDSPSGKSQPASILVSRSRAGRSEVHSLNGAARVISKKTGKPLVLKPTVLAPSLTEFDSPLQSSPSHSQLQEVKSQPLVLEKPKPTILLKTADRAIFSRQSSMEAQKLEWRSQGAEPKDQFVVEVKTKPEETLTLAKETTKSDELTLKAPLQDGTYFWRVRLLDSKNAPLAESDYQSFKIVTLTPPTWVTPRLEPKTLTSTIPNSQGNLDMQWSSQWALAFEWQLDTDNKFQSLMDQGLIESSDKISIKKPNPGVYFARARAKKTKEPEEILWTPWSPIATLTVEAPPLSSLPAPIPTQLKIAVSLNSTDPRSPAAIPPAKVSWRKVARADSYIVEVSDGPDFSVAKKFVTKNLSQNFDQYTGRRHLARIRSQSRSGIISPPSSLIEINLELPKPQLKSIPNRLAKSDNPEAKAPPQNLQAVWSPVPFTKQYRFEISKNHKFQPAQVFESQTSQIPFKIHEPGLYYARVKPMDPHQDQIASFSNVVQFEYVYKSTLRAPALAEPLNLATVFLQQDLEPFIWLEWKTDPAAIKYEIQVSNDSNFKKVLFNSVLEKNRFLVKEKLPFGPIYWRVRAHAKTAEQNSKWSTVRVFNLVHKKNEGVVE